MLEDESFETTQIQSQHILRGAICQQGKSRLPDGRGSETIRNTGWRVAALLFSLEWFACAEPLPFS
jgi:hypothetical protein